jgi:hypothetical protein
MRLIFSGADFGNHNPATLLSITFKTGIPIDQRLESRISRDQRSNRKGVNLLPNILQSDGHLNEPLPTSASGCRLAR